MPPRCMIYFLLFKEFSFTIKKYLAIPAGNGLSNHIAFLYYEDLPDWNHLPRGTYVFSDLDRLSPAQTDFVCAVWDQLAAVDPPLRLLNNPHKVMHRYQLCSTLYEAGRNQFQVWRASEADRVNRFPVFVRLENDHTGSLSKMIHSQKELHKVLWAKRREGVPQRDLLIVEFLDISDQDGVFRKYAAFKVGDQIIPRNVQLSKEWVVKGYVSMVDEAWAQEAKAYIENNPHETWLRETFEWAHIDYGRIDYSLLGDAPQVWEINLNPTLGPGRKKRNPNDPNADYKRALREPISRLFAESFLTSIQALDGLHSPTEPDDKIVLSDSARQRLKNALRKEQWGQSFRKSASWGYSKVAQMINPVYRKLRQATRSM